jgi:hypothetical protein
MTREEAIFCEKSYLGETNCTDCKYYGTDTCESRETHKMSIKALEREPVLDKIRAEISKAWYTQPKNRYEEGLKDQALKDMKIIDKYKAESEDKL